MAITTNLPPQAYTRDTLVKAIEWLGTQPQSVRERATSADLLVNIYLVAKRKAAVQMEAPVSGETFKTDLKHLVEDLKQFEEPSSPHTATPPPTRSPSSGHSTYTEAVYEPIFKPEPVAPQRREEPRHEPRHEPATPPKVPTWHMDARSLAAAREVQQRLNLSSEGEAVRLLITLGMERARDLFP